MPIRSATGRRIVVIADDLTGANDTGVQFAKQGLKTLVLMRVEGPFADLEEDVLVIDTQSRAMQPEDAYRAVQAAALLFRDRDAFEAVYKKIDSTLRGNLGTEIDAVMDACGLELAVVAPAFPQNGRTTVGGIHFMAGIPLEATEIGRDPVCPVNESHIPTLLSLQSRRAVGHVGLKDVLAGPDGILNAMRRQRAAGRAVLVCDAWREEHLKMIALAASRLEKPVLWVGSAGLAEHVPSVLGVGAAPAGRSPILVIAGSVSGVTRNQVALLSQRSDVVFVEADPCSFLEPAAAQAETERCCRIAVEAIRSGKDIVIVSGYRDELVARTIETGRSSGLSGRQTSEAVAAALGGLCSRIASGARPGGLVLTGGDIARSCCSRLSADGISVTREVVPGIPMGVLKGGPFSGLNVVTKAGAFGAQDALCRAVDSLKMAQRVVEKAPAS